MIRAFPGSARVSRAGGGAGVCPACRADPSGDTAVRNPQRPVAAPCDAGVTGGRTQFPQTPLWQASCARFMPPVVERSLCPASLLERFSGKCRRSTDATPGLSCRRSPSGRSTCLRVADRPQKMADSQPDRGFVAFAPGSERRRRHHTGRPLLSSTIDPLKRDRWARLRFSIIGPLLAAPPAAGELQAALSPARHQSAGDIPSRDSKCAFGQVDAGALVLRRHGTFCRPGRHPQRPTARQHRPFPQHPVHGPSRCLTHPVPRTSRLDRTTAPRQSARRTWRALSHAVAVLPHRSTLPQGSGHVPTSPSHSAPPKGRHWPVTASNGWRSGASKSIIMPSKSPSGAVSKGA
jgi:hypothetical protein